MIKKVALGIVLLVAVGLASFFALAWRPEIAAVAPPSASTFAPSLVASGAVLAGAGDCAICHTAKGGQPFAGGLAFPTNFGTVYSSNITPDPETGIGSWSEAAFRRALHEGVAREERREPPEREEGIDALRGRSAEGDSARLLVASAGGTRHDEERDGACQGERPDKRDDECDQAHSDERHRIDTAPARRT